MGNPMGIISLHDKERIYQSLKKDPYLHIYSIGDLDDFYWPQTIWFGLLEGEQLTQVALLYRGLDMPTLLALSVHPQEMGALLESIKATLPPQFYAHLSPGLDALFRDTHAVTDHGRHLKMALLDRSSLQKQPIDDVIHIPPSDLPALRSFYEESYPGHWFDPRMLQTGQYYGIKSQGEYISVGGVHVYSPEYNVAALGNIATHPGHRNRGYASQVTAYLCQSLLEQVSYVGLNVKESNQPALSCYQKLGFQVVAAYHECTITLK